jgi:phenylpropionate dioxygenase-like ring-hydroxylating dioxygenase large terminal subunit
VTDLSRIDKDRYVSKAFMTREWDSMWRRVWLLAAHVSELREPGRFVTLDVGPESLLVVAQDDGTVRAFFNVCQHRGTRLSIADRGKASRFRCPYHHWEWECDGRLHHVPDAASFVAGVPCDELRLAGVPCALRLGFVWVAMGPDVEDIDAYLAPFAAEIAAYRPEALSLVGENVVEVECNWKTSVDVHNEGYHLRSLHPELARVVDLDRQRITLRGRHSRIDVPIATPAPGSPLGPELQGMLRYFGVDPAGLATARGDVRGAIRSTVLARAQVDGVDLSALDDEQLVDKRQFYVFPNTHLNFSALSLEVYRHRPHATNPEMAYFDDLTFARPSLAPKGEPKRHRMRPGDTPLGSTLSADLELVPRLQSGMRSSGFRGLYLSSLEGGIANMHRVLDEYLGA